MYSAVSAAAISGIRASKVLVEADVSEGFPVFSMVGFLSSEVREAGDRVRTAIRNCGFFLPPGRITLSLSPADLRKEGSGFDLPIAVAILGAMGCIPQADLSGILFAGELGLKGNLVPIRGVLEIASRASFFNCHTVIVPEENLKEGSVVRDVRVLGAKTLQDVVNYLSGRCALTSSQVDPDALRSLQESAQIPDFSDLKGQESLRRAAEIAVCGMHSLLIIGPPGSGKTMAARRIPSILPRMTLSEALEVSRIHSVAGTLPPQTPLLMVRPFRSPHHSVTAPALAGGGLYPRPGEISLAHRGVLYLDELPEFDPSVLEILRQPMEEGVIRLSRRGGTYEFPARFMLVASMNPCKCGYYPNRRICRCSPQEVRRYLNRLSRPLLDRIDLTTEVGEMTFDTLSSLKKGESSGDIRARVEAARDIQKRRYEGTPFQFNRDLSGDALKTYCRLGQTQSALMKKAFLKMNLTGRSYDRVLKTARSIADLDGSDQIEDEHLQEALRYRAPDFSYWGGEL